MEAVWILFDDTVRVDYHQFFIGGAEAGASGYGTGGQVNGLCGAAHPGVLAFTTGRNCGELPLLIELHEEEPELDAMWTEVVEVSFTPSDPDVLLLEPGFQAILIDLEVETYRVRYCAAGFDNEDRVVDDPPERYLVQFWPAPAAPDRIVRQTSSVAAYWHDVAHRTPPEPTAAERAETARQEKQEHQRRADEYRRAQEAEAWNGRAPDNDRLRGVGASARDVARADRDLVDENVAADPREQRAMAAWTARWAAHRAGHADLPWVAEALAALDRADPLPPSFDSSETAFGLLWAESAGTAMHAAVAFRLSTPLGDIEFPTLSPEVAMVWTILATRAEDPLDAAMRTLSNALHGGPVDLAAFRAAFGLPRS
jgi:hypothetical protein